MCSTIMNLLVSCRRMELILEYNGILIPSRFGRKHILMLAGYTYYQVNRSIHWYCPSTSKKCPAKVKRLRNGEVLRTNVTHNHDPPRYILKNGVYTRVYK